MSARAKRNIHWLHVLRHANQDQCKAILKVADDDLVKCLCECVHNVLCRNVPVSSGQECKLCSHANSLRKLDDKQVDVDSKRKILVQQGGALLPLILPAVIAVLTALID